MALRILLVDDNDDTLRLYTKAILKRVRIDGVAPYVESIDRVTSALDLLSTQPFNLVVIDMKIPGSSGEVLGGFEVISASLKLDPLRPIIAITGYGTIDMVRKALTQGVFDFIEKSPSADDDLIAAIERAIESRTETALRSGNPFAPMAGVEPTVFGGRTKELRFFEDKLNRTLQGSNSMHFLVIGTWGIGKSSLLKEYKKICTSRGQVAAVVPLEPFRAGSRLSKVACSIVEGILRDLPYPIEQFPKLSAYFSAIGMKIQGTGLSLPDPDISPQALLHDTLLSLWQDLQHRTAVLVILLDDLECLREVFEIILTLKQTLSSESIKNARILVGIAGTPASWLELTSSSPHHPISRFFLSRVELEPLNKEDLRETIVKTLTGTGVSFSTPVIEKVLEYTAGHPFEMQLLCYHLYNNQLSRRVDLDLWDKAWQETIADLGGALFKFWIEKVTAEELNVLRCMAASETPLSLDQISLQVLETNKTIQVARVPDAIEGLVNRGLVDRNQSGVYRLKDQMFRDFIRACPQT